MTIRQRAEWRRRAFKVARELQAEGCFEGLSEQEKIALVIAGTVTPELVAADPQFDWEGLLAFLEAIVPLILQIIAIFA